MKKSIKYIELLIMFIAFICCFIPCVVYKNNMIINIYVFDANTIMGYLYMILLIFGIIYKILLIRNKKENSNFINKYFSLIVLTVTTILYTISCLLRTNIWIKFSIGFYIVIGCFISILLLYIIKFIIIKKKDKKKIKKN